MNNVFVYCEIEGTQVQEVSQELLTKGRKLANTLGVELHAIVAGTGNNSVELNTQFIGELATLGQQLLRYFLYLSTFYLAIYKYVIHISINQ